MDDRALDKFLKAPPIVTPRKRRFPALPVIALYRDMAMSESGELISETVFLKNLPKMSSTLFIKLDAAGYIAELDAKFKRQYPGTWNCRFITKETSLMQPNGFYRPVREQVVCHYFGWKTSGSGSFHKILDPAIFLEKKLPNKDHEPYVRTLLDWGIALRDFCHENGIEVRATAGAVSGQFLTDPRFYPDARRKVPRATNDKIREVLPGNYYSLTPEPRPDREYTAHYLDQQRAHHYHAARIAFPNSNELYAYGRFVDVAACVFPDVWDSFHGIYCLDLLVPETRKVPRWIRDILDHHATESTPITKRYVYSNEIPALLDWGYRVVGVRAAWGSHKLDTGLNTYAVWASSQLEAHPHTPWLKRLFLATYGVLAITPRDSVSLYSRAKKGELATVRVGSTTFTGYRLQQRTKLEPRLANVLHRGMIEAACRIESIGYADYLENHGYNVLSIYSDAVIIEADESLPIPVQPDPWRMKRTLTHLRFLNTQAYMSAEEDKIPGGMGREILQYIQQSPGRAPRPHKWHKQPTS